MGYSIRSVDLDCLGRAFRLGPVQFGRTVRCVMMRGYSRIWCSLTFRRDWREVKRPLRGCAASFGTGGRVPSSSSGGTVFVRVRSPAHRLGVPRKVAASRGLVSTSRRLVRFRIAPNNVRGLKDGKMILCAEFVTRDSVYMTPVQETHRKTDVTEDVPFCGALFVGSGFARLRTPRDRHGVLVSGMTCGLVS